MDKYKYQIKLISINRIDRQKAYRWQVTGPLCEEYDLRRMRRSAAVPEYNYPGTIFVYLASH